MKNSEIKQKVLNEIKSLKLWAEYKADKNLEKALENSEFKKLYSEIKSLNFSIAKKEFLNEDTKTLNDELTKKEQELSSLAQKLNFKMQDFKPKYSCLQCNDTAMDRQNYCKCFYEKLNKEIINNLGINVDKLHEFKNSDFKIFDNPETMKKVYFTMENWCNSLSDTKYKTILLSGSTGVGKTYLIDCMTNALINKNVVVNYYTAFMLNDLFLKYRSSFYENRAGILDDVLNCDVLFVDDLGAEPNIKNSEEYFYLLFNERTLKNKFTVVTTNLSLDKLMLRYGERTFSRLCNKKSSLLLNIENKDLRLKK